MREMDQDGCLVDQEADTHEASNTEIFYGDRYSLERSADGNTLTFEAKFNVPVWSVTKYLVTNYPYDPDLRLPEADTPVITEAKE